MDVTNLIKTNIVVREICLIRYIKLKFKFLSLLYKKVI